MKLLRIRQLTIESKSLTFNISSKSKVVHLALVKYVPLSTIVQLEKIKKQFIWKNGNPKLKHTTLCNEYEKEGPEMYVFSKITSP